MTMQSNFEQTNRIRLLPHQAKFIEGFLKPGSPAYHHLVSPTGMGKTTMLTGLIQRLVDEQHVKRILILARPSLVVMFEHTFREVGLQELPVRIVDKKVFRDLEVDSDAYTPPWQTPILAIMSIETARQEEIALSLFSVKWDLVVVDEFRATAGQRLQFIERFVQSGAVVRLLLVSTKTDEHLPPWRVNDLQLTEWPGEIRDWDGTLLYSLPKRIARVEYYERSAPEIKFIQKLKTYLDSQAKFRIRNIERHLLLRAASSSIYAVESALRNRRNKLVHGDFTSIPNEELEDADSVGEEREDNSHSASPEDSKVELSALTALLEEIDAIQIDSKADLLRRLLSELSSNGKEQIVIFARFASTASYLHTYLANTSQAVYLITGNMPVSERANAIHQIRQSGRIVITSAISLEGLDFGGKRIGVSFDLPQSHLEMERRWSALGRRYRDGDCTMYALCDKSGILAFEEIELRKYKFLADSQDSLRSQKG